MAASVANHESSTSCLPIYKYKRDIIKAIEESKSLVIVGETGSGKSTQLPKFLYEAGYGKYGLVGVTQPRRVAAISVASRVAEELQCTLGHQVGYQVRFDDRTSKDTVIKYMTDGCLLREFLDDKELSRYSVIVLDEAHERSLDTDILFGLVKQLFLTSGSSISSSTTSSSSSTARRRRPLKVIVMSATLDHGKFSSFMGNCPVFEIPGRLYPVQKVYCDLIEEQDVRRDLTVNYVAKVVDTVMDIHLEQKQGDILVFLTGQAEIEKACDMLFKKSERVDYKHDVKDTSVEALMVLPVYGSMATEAQRRIFHPAERGVRKCVVATNIAGTSLTIDGIRYVVDSGFVKQLSFNPRTGLDALQIVPVSRSEAIQRAGRAGRTAPGKCYRIYTEAFYDNAMSEDMIPEIQRTSLTSVVLNLKCMGIHNILQFPYVDPPDERMLLEALRQLYYFGAIDKAGRITPLGRLMVEYPLPPGLARAVVYSGALNCQEFLLPIAAMLSVENVFIRPGDPGKQKEASKAHSALARIAGGANDFATLLAIFRNYVDSESPSSWCRKNFIHLRAVKTAVSVHKQLEGILNRQVKTSFFPKEKVPSSTTHSDLLRRSLCAGFFCNVARKASSGRGFHTMEGHGTTVFIHPSSALFGHDDALDWVIYHEVVWTSKVFMRTVSAVKYEWIEDLLPRLHELDAYGLSGCLAPNIEENINATSEDSAQDANSKIEKVEKSQSPEEKRVKVEKRNNDDSVADARQRYLERKKAKQK